MLNLIDVRNEIQRNIITKMAEQNSQYYNLLLGYNKVTASMTGEHKVRTTEKIIDVLMI